MIEMKHEMHSWKRERKARRFASGWIFLLISLSFFACRMSVPGVALVLAGVGLVWSAR
jgi:hypothetical protein